MAQQDLPQEPTPLSPIEYWQESLSAWGDFSKRTTEILFGQLSARRTETAISDDTQAETLASELLRTVSDMNLRHWQNTARLMESLPGWMQVPHNLVGSAMVEWFDNVRRDNEPLVFGGTQGLSGTPVSETPKRPERLAKKPKKPDDLTRIKGIGPKLSTLLNELGIYKFKQIASWTEPEARWVDDYLAFKGRVAREAWIDQARKLSANGSATLH